MKQLSTSDRTAFIQEVEMHSLKNSKKDPSPERLQEYFAFILEAKEKQLAMNQLIADLLYMPDSPSKSTVLKEEIQKQTGCDSNRAEAIENEIYQKFQAARDEDRQRKAKAPGFIWTCVNIPPTKENKLGEVRPSHWQLNGKYFNWDNLPVVDGEKMSPGKATGGCRCKAKMTFSPK